MTLAMMALALMLLPFIFTTLFADKGNIRDTNHRKERNTQNHIFDNIFD
jgi:hypothetical protein